MSSAGCVITISGRMTFTSNKSMEIEVLVDADPVVDNSQKRYRAASAFFTYVSLNQEGKPLPVPQLVVSVLRSNHPVLNRVTQACDHGLCSGLVKSLEESLVSCRLEDGQMGQDRQTSLSSSPSWLLML